MLADGGGERGAEAARSESRQTRSGRGTASVCGVALGIDKLGKRVAEYPCP